MKGRLLRPSEELRQSLEANIAAARESERLEAIRKQKEADAELHREQVYHAANITNKGPCKHEVTSGYVTYISTWIDIPGKSSIDGKPQIRLVRHDQITKRFLGIPVKRSVNYVTAELRLSASTFEQGKSLIETVILFGKNAANAPVGVYVPIADTKKSDVANWQLAEVGSDDWKEVTELLTIAESELPKLTEFVD